MKNNKKTLTKEKNSQDHKYVRCEPLKDGSTAQCLTQDAEILNGDLMSETSVVMERLSSIYGTDEKTSAQ